MILISHRGNIKGKNPNKENSTDHIKHALRLGFDVEVDVWLIDNQLFLGHDEPQYETNLEFLNNVKLWCHTKNLEALEKLLIEGVHCFWHQNDDYAITSKGIIWAYPGKRLNEKTICVMPETLGIGNLNNINCLGICSDFIQSIS